VYVTTTIQSPGVRPVMVIWPQTVDCASATAVVVTAWLAEPRVASARQVPPSWTRPGTAAETVTLPPLVDVQVMMTPGSAAVG